MYSVKLKTHFSFVDRLECRLNIPEIELQFVSRYTEADVCTADFLYLFFLLLFFYGIVEEYLFFHAEPRLSFLISKLLLSCPFFLLLLQQRVSQPCIPIQNTLLHLCFPTFKSHQCYIIAHTQHTHAHTNSYFLLWRSCQKSFSSHNRFPFFLFCPNFHLHRVIICIFLSEPELFCSARTKVFWILF